MNQDRLKSLVAEAAINYIESDLHSDSILGVGTGSTANFFIDYLAGIKHKFRAAVASSKETQIRLQERGIEVLDLNFADEVTVYVDGADETNEALELIKGGGGALTREKIIASAARTFVCIVDSSKCVETLGKFSLPVEVIPMARSLVARKLFDLGGNPVYRGNFLTDNGNAILDVHNLTVSNAKSLEETINSIVGTVTNGLFALRPADVLLVGTSNEVLEKKLSD